MGEITNIQWTDHTFNTWIGCSKVAPGCQHCYAEADMDHRRHRVVWGVNGTRSVTTEDYWKQPLKWNREAEKQGIRSRVFCASLADVFEDWEGEVSDGTGAAHYTSDEDVTKVATNQQMMGCDSDGYHYTTLNDCRARLFRLIDQTQWLDWLLLTKRPQNIRRMWLNREPEWQRCENVWLGTSVSCNSTANDAIQQLAKCRDLSPVLFMSIEPILASVDLDLKHPGNSCQGEPIDWVIVGGESGPQARPCRTEWIRSVVKQCRIAGVPCFVKQMGSNVIERNDMFCEVDENYWPESPEPTIEYDIHGFRENYQGADCRVHLKHRKGGDPFEWPEALRVRQFPESHEIQ